MNESGTRRGAAAPVQRRVASIRREASHRAVAFLVFVSAATVTTQARANGAYPDGLSILLPTDRPQAVALATNFGIIASEDDGQTWEWSCEQTATSGGNLYSLGPAPADRIYALSVAGLAFSNDRACTWGVAGGQFNAFIGPLDYFADPNDANHVLAIGADYRQEPPQDSVFSSTDGAQTFGDPIYIGPNAAVLTGVEIARGDASTVYVSMVLGGAGGKPALARTSDGGATWTVYDVSALKASVAALQDVRIIAIDPANPLRVFLRIVGVSDETLAVVDVSADAGASEDAGAAQVATPIHVMGMLTGWLERSDGTIIVSSLDANGKGVGFESVDGALSFTPWPKTGAIPALRAIAERSGLLYGAADDLGADGFALGVSSDDGASWTPIMKYSAVTGVMECASAQCLTTCTYEASIMLWSANLCAPVADAAAPAGDAEATASDSSYDTGLDADLPSDASTPTQDATGNASEPPIDAARWPAQSSEPSGAGGRSGGCAASPARMTGRFTPRAAFEADGGRFFIVGVSLAWVMVRRRRRASFGDRG